jgi:predicted esterase
MFSDKISGARRKLKKAYDLIFIDAPLPVKGEQPHSLAWWTRDEDSSMLSPNNIYNDSYRQSIHQALEYVQRHPLVQGQSFDILLGFSQGGTLATALVVGGCIQGIQAVVTAGAPYVPEALEVAQNLQASTIYPDGLSIPKLHLAGSTDLLVPVESTRKLCEAGGNGVVLLHEQGHLFPTRSVPVEQIMNFLESAIYKK